MSAALAGLLESKQPQEVITRETRFLRDLIETERMIVAVVDKLTRATEPLKCLEIR